jgi:hypothetical protein
VPEEGALSFLAAAEQFAGPNDEQRGQPHVPIQWSLSRSSSSVSSAFNPAPPQSNSPLSSAEIRGHIASLKDLIG